MQTDTAIFPEPMGSLRLIAATLAVAIYTIAATCLYVNAAIFLIGDGLLLELKEWIRSGPAIGSFALMVGAIAISMPFILLWNKLEVDMIVRLLGRIPAKRLWGSIWF